MPELSVVTVALIAVNVAHSMYAFRQSQSGGARERFLFVPSDVVRGRNLQGMVRSSFSHADGTHLAFNMFTLFFFGPVVEQALGPLGLLAVYVGSDMGATLLTLANHHHDPGYRSLGASGAISGVLFAAIVIAPTMGVSMLFIPIAIPAPFFALAYLGYSLFGARTSLGNIGHHAHLGGAATGFLLAGWLASDGFQRLYAAVHRLVS